MGLEKGMVQIYTGEGKGKSTAAIGQGIRSAGNGLKVIMIQFLKSRETGELKILEKLNDNFKVIRMETSKGFFWNMSEEEKEVLKNEVQQELRYAAQTLKNDECDVLILDEIFGALKNKLISEEEILNLLEGKNSDTEVILTGRNAPERIIEKADLVTEMKNIKHYYTNGVMARKGIEY
ncbi:MAG: cob(I)yrinic acid a,c-diamide adenosyltransferase [Clostridiaceae bacterium]